MEAAEELPVYSCTGIRNDRNEVSSRRSTERSDKCEKVALKEADAGVRSSSRNVFFTYKEQFVLLGLESWHWVCP